MLLIFVLFLFIMLETVRGKNHALGLCYLNDELECLFLWFLEEKERQN